MSMDDKTFLNRLEQSRRDVEKFAAAVAPTGVTVLLPPAINRDCRENWADYSDDGDAVVHFWIEHKKRSFSFTSREDYPYQTVIIDEVYKVNSKPHPCCMYVIQDKTLQHAAIIYGWTRPFWKKERMFDKAVGRHVECYTVDKENVRFCKNTEVFTCPASNGVL